MNKVLRISYFENESYRCNHCGNDKININEAQDTWRCSDCENYIYIYASDDGGRGVFIRKKASEIERGDWVRPDHFELSQHYLVLGVNKMTTKANNGKLGIGLKEYRQIIVSPEDIISCRVGGW